MPTTSFPNYLYSLNINPPLTHDKLEEIKSSLLLSWTDDNDRDQNPVERALLFLTFCQQRSNDNSASIWPLAVDWLLDLASKETDETQKKALCTEIQEALNYFLDQNPSEAIRYCYNQTKLNAYPVIKVKFYYALATELLQHQKDPSGIIPLLSAFFDEPHQFAAMLIWLVNNGVTPSTLIKSSILHELVAYQLPTLEEENRDEEGNLIDNPVKLIFNLLRGVNNNENITKLISEASETSCQSKFHTEMRGFEHISLAGDITERVKKSDANMKGHNLTLTSTLKIKPSPTLTENNIKNLYYCFGSFFLDQIVTLENLSYYKNDRLNTCLSELFKLPFVLETLPDFFDRLCVRYDKGASIFKKLASLIDINTTKEMLSKTPTTIHLALYQEELLSTISNYINNAEMLGKFLKQLGSSNWYKLLLKLDAEKIAHIIPSAHELSVLLKQLPENARIIFVGTKFAIDYLRFITRDVCGLTTLLNSLPWDAWKQCIDILGFKHVRGVIYNKPSIEDFFKGLEKKALYSYLISIATNDNQNHIKAFLTNMHVLSSILSNIPPIKWDSLISNLKGNLLTKIICNEVQLSYFIEQIPSKDIPTFLVILERQQINFNFDSADIMEIIAREHTADTMRNFCKAEQSQILSKSATQGIKKTIGDRHRKSSSYDLSSEEFDTLIKQQLFFTRSLKYFVTKADDPKVTPNNFNARINDYCALLSVMTKFFVENENKDVSQNEFETCIGDYINSMEGTDALKNIRSSGTKKLAIFKTSTERYIRHREFAATLDVQTFFVRYKEFREAINTLAANNLASPSEKDIAQKFQAAFDKGERKNDEQPNIIIDYSIDNLSVHLN